MKNEDSNKQAQALREHAAALNKIADEIERGSIGSNYFSGDDAPPPRKLNIPKGNAGFGPKIKIQEKKGGDDQQST